MTTNFSRHKLTYLKSYLKGYALKIVTHLQVTDSNYQIALDMLDAEFLNKPALIDDLIRQLLSLKPKFDQTFLETKMYINTILID